MNTRDNARDIADQAAEWAARIDGGRVDPATDERLQRWLAQDSRASGALLRAEAALSFTDRGRALAGVIARPSPRAFWRRPLATWSTAAVAATLLGIVLWFTLPHRYDTGLGEVREVPLSDGSLIAINTQSSVAVTMRDDLRSVELSRGEAWFRVAHDVRRPFVVSAGRVRVRAVGTAFSVRRHDDGADVIVTEGVVETWTTDAQDHPLRVAAGSKAFVARYEPARVVATAATEVTRSLAWRDGQIALEGQTLGEAVAQFNRHNARQIVIADPDLAQQALVGQFSVTDPMAFAAAAATTLGAVVVQDGDTIRLTRPSRP